MIKVTPPLLEHWNNIDHDCFIVAVENATAQPAVYGSAPDLRTGRRTCEAMNATTTGDYPRWIAVSKSACYFDPDAAPPARLPVRHPVGAYRGPFPLVLVVAHS
jgi:hypothetical protein